jgi:hypothetical protein
LFIFFLAIAGVSEVPITRAVSLPAIIKGLKGLLGDGKEAYDLLKMRPKMLTKFARRFATKS